MDKLFTLYDNLENQMQGFEHPNDIFELGGFDQLIQKPFAEVLQSVLVTCDAFYFLPFAGRQKKKQGHQILYSHLKLKTKSPTVLGKIGFFFL